MGAKHHLGYLEISGEGVVMPGEGSRVGDSHPGVFFRSTGRRNDPPTDISLSNKPLRTGKHRVQHSGSPSFL